MMDSIDAFISSLSLFQECHIRSLHTFDLRIRDIVPCMMYFE